MAESESEISLPVPPSIGGDSMQSDDVSDGSARHESDSSSAKSPSDEGNSSRKSLKKSYVCPHCSQTYTRQHNLKSHLLTHSHEKPYDCDNCGAKFRRLHDLKRHHKLHTGERPYQCDKCGRRFARADALVRHSKAAGPCSSGEPSTNSGANVRVLNVSSTGYPLPLPLKTGEQTYRPHLIGPSFFSNENRELPHPLTSYSHHATPPQSQAGSSSLIQPISSRPPHPPHPPPAAAPPVESRSEASNADAWAVVRLLEGRIRVIEERLYVTEGRVLYLENQLNKEIDSRSEPQSA
ncbi:hypothetical protein TRVA0_059S00672 [Trichomonascus vanleenenianus]|uniref:C2H2-type zinc finger protein n=1 Tax=Trichomonascus vanleenenianus TaxID=2268995 RepID=UPI003ECA241C